jgi:hypothetical protein
MTALDLPEPIAAYFQADIRDARDVARCFTRRGVVLDEGRTYEGPAAIEAWKAGASRRYRYTTQPQRIEREGDRYVVIGQVTGDFPSSPAELRYIFAVERGRISSLEIRT